MNFSAKFLHFSKSSSKVLQTGSRSPVDIAQTSHLLSHDQGFDHPLRQMRMPRPRPCPSFEHLFAFLWGSCRYNHILHAGPALAGSPDDRNPVSATRGYVCVCVCV